VCVAIDRSDSLVNHICWGIILYYYNVLFACLLVCAVAVAFAFAFALLLFLICLVLNLN